MDQEVDSCSDTSVRVNDLRPMIPLEKEALAAWVRGTLVLEEPPGFIQATHSKAMRASFLQFFEQNLQGRLAATIPPEVFIANHTAETTLLIELRMATSNLKLIDPDILAKDDLPTDETSTKKRKNHALNYQTGVLTHDLTAFEVMQIIATIARQTLAESKAYNSNYFLVIFKSENCPPQLKNVTHISAGKEVEDLFDKRTTLGTDRGWGKESDDHQTDRRDKRKAKQSTTVKQATKAGSKSDGWHNSVGGKINFGRASYNATQQQRERSASLGAKPKTQSSSKPHSSQSTGNNPAMGKNDDSRATKASLDSNGKPKSGKAFKTEESGRA
ncbi:hypothetical protein Plhal304r1_c066g0154371 [Plasmopara halstedii]